MTHRRLVGGAGPADGAGRLGLADAPGDLAVGAGLAGRDLGQRLPDLPLEGGADDVERHVGRVEGGRLAAVEAGQHAFHARAQRAVVARDLGRREVVVQAISRAPGRCRPGRPRQCPCASPPPGRGHSPNRPSCSRCGRRRRPWHRSRESCRVSCRCSRRRGSASRSRRHRAHRPPSRRCAAPCGSADACAPPASRAGLTPSSAMKRLLSAPLDSPTLRATAASEGGVSARPEFEKGAGPGHRLAEAEIGPPFARLAALAGTEPRRLGGVGRGVEVHVVPERRPGPHRTAGNRPRSI